MTIFYRDVFSGSGDLSSHTPDVGQPYSGSGMGAAQIASGLRSPYVGATSYLTTTVADSRYANDDTVKLTSLEVVFRIATPPALVEVEPGVWHNATFTMLRIRSRGSDNVGFDVVSDSYHIDGPDPTLAPFCHIAFSSPAYSTPNPWSGYVFNPALTYTFGTDHTLLFQVNGDDGVVYLDGNLCFTFTITPDFNELFSDRVEIYMQGGGLGATQAYGTIKSVTLNGIGPPPSYFWCEDVLTEERALV